MFSRRQFLASIAAGCTGLAAWRYFSSSDIDAIVAVVQKRLHYLKLEPNGLYSFARDLVKTQIVSSTKLRLLDMAGPVYTLLSSHMDKSSIAKELNHGEERIVSLYLLSSDFFQNGHDETRLVRYVEFYDPFVNIQPCMSPFARPVST